MTSQSAQLMAASRQPAAPRGRNAEGQCQNEVMSKWLSPSTSAGCEQAGSPQGSSGDPTTTVPGTLTSMEGDATEESGQATCLSAQQAAASEQQTVPQETNRSRAEQPALEGESSTAEGGR